MACAQLARGVIMIENDYLDEFRVRIAPSELLRLLDWRIEIMESEDFQNPHANFESIEVEHDAISGGQP